MNFDLTTEQKLLQKAAKDFASKEIEPLAPLMEKGQALPADFSKKLGDARFLGMLCPRKYGGSDAGYFSFILVLEQLSYPVSACAWLPGIHNSVAEAIYRFGTEEARTKYLPGICSGEYIASIVFTEPGTGSDPGSLTTTASFEGDSWLVNGTKRFHSLGNMAGPAMIVVREGDFVSCLLVDKDSPGYSSSKSWDFMGYVGLPCVDTYLNNVRVLAGNLMGERGKGFDVLVKMISGAKIASCARSLALSQAALDEAVKYAKGRPRRGSPIAAMMPIQAVVAEIASRLEAARWITYRAAFLREKGSDTLLDTAKAKLFVTRVAKEAADMSLQVHGAYGFTRDFKIERIYRAAREGEIVEGSSEIQRTIISNYVLA